MARLLLVEDEDRLARSIRVGLEDEDYLVDRARDGEEALWLAGSGHHDAMILDLRLPKVGGIEVCRRLRRSGSVLPVLMLTASDTPGDVVTGLDVGADDYLTKPFVFEILLARIRALLRRGSAGGSSRYEVADLVIDATARRAWRAGVELDLSAMEYRLIEHLARHAGRVQSKARIAKALWDDPIGPESNVLEVLISKLRKKLERSSAGAILHTRRGEGYLLGDGDS